MIYSRTEEKLIEAMQSMEIIDCHEHLVSEQERISQPQDVFTLFSNYTRLDMFSAGMDRNLYTGPFGGEVIGKVASRLMDRSISLEKRWREFEPYWRVIQHGSYARAAKLAASIFYNIEKIDNDTYQELSLRIVKANVPGLYQKVFDLCRIKAILTQSGKTDVAPPLFPIMHYSLAYGDVQTREQVEKYGQELGMTINTLEDYLHFLKELLDKWVKEGTVGIKIASYFNKRPDRTAAEKSFRRMMRGETLTVNGWTLKPTEYEPLHNFLLHFIIDLATERGLTISVHAGVWYDYRNLACQNLITLAPAHSEANFELYHLGMPYVRDALMIAKNLPNVFLNLCWSHAISQVQTCSAVDEMLDEVPINKILAFGGDYSTVEKIIGHLHMAREDFAKVLGRRIDAGMLDIQDAMDILYQWFWKNPLNLYPSLKNKIT